MSMSTITVAQQGVSALVVGISHYDQIQDLSYADKDAERFRAYLKSAFGEIDIRFYTNDSATYDHIQLGLDELLIDANPGDTVFFYFSGHGDCETHLQGEPGFLLSHDTPPNNYWHRALRLNELKEQLESYSSKQLNFILVVDACRAGKLVSSHEGGPGKTAIALMNLFQQQLMFVSCLPDEISLELSKYESGLFTYYLVEGLQGRADHNDDGELKVEELDRYVRDKVVAQSGAKQTPDAIGDPRRTIPMVPPIRQPHIAIGKRGFGRPSATQIAQSSPPPSNIPSAIPEGYFQLSPKEIEKRFKKAIKENRLLEPGNNNAKYYYQIYPAKDEAGQKTHQKMRSRLLNALKKHPRDILLDYVFDEISIISQDLQAQSIRQLQAGLSMLLPSSHLHKGFQVRLLFFQALQQKSAHHYKNLNALPILEKAVSLDPYVAFLYYELGLVYFDNERYEESRSAALQALELSPAWQKAYDLLVQPTPHQLPLTYRGARPISNIELPIPTSYSSGTRRGLKSGQYYKIQLVAVRQYNQALQQKIRPFHDIGYIDTEFLPERRLNRILLGDFRSLQEARTSLSIVQKQGFTQAFICEYNDGVRIRQVK